MKLVIGNKNYSSWSLRPWMFLKSHNIAFDEIQESLNQENLSAALRKYSGSSKVPVLIDQGLAIWDSLAICEYISDNFLDGKGWPIDQGNKAIARAVSSEMHSSFLILRSEMPMNCRLQGKLELNDALEKDIERIAAIWANYAAKDVNGDLRLFGEFSIADCFYAPVALRFRTYGVELDGLAAEYHSSLLDHPSLIEWVKLARQEKEVMPNFDILHFNLEG